MTAKPFCDGPFRVLKGSSWIVGKDKHGDDCHVLDQRGWGYLTGKGHAAMGLDTAIASVMQADMQQWVVDAMNAAWNRRADLAAVQPAQVRVKPLVWEEPCYTNNWIHVARSVFGDYYISIDGGRHSAWLEANVKPYENKIGDEVGSVIEAMMLAETDYQARMQPLITPLPDQTVEIDLRVAMMEELEKAASESLWVPEEYYMNEVISDCCAFLRSDRSQPDPRDEVIARLVEENNWQIKARAQHWLRRTISAPEDAAVEEICEKYGYGAVMDAASRLWARKPYGSGAFYVGGCIGFKSDDEARAALAAAKAVQK